MNTWVMKKVVQKIVEEYSVKQCEIADIIGTKETTLTNWKNKEECFQGVKWDVARINILYWKFGEKISSSNCLFIEEVKKLWDWEDDIKDFLSQYMKENPNLWEEFQVKISDFYKNLKENQIIISCKKEKVQKRPLPNDEARKAINNIELNFPNVSKVNNDNNFLVEKCEGSRSETVLEITVENIDVDSMAQVEDSLLKSDLEKTEVSYKKFENIAEVSTAEENKEKDEVTIPENKQSNQMMEVEDSLLKIDLEKQEVNCEKSENIDETFTEEKEEVTIDENIESNQMVEVDNSLLEPDLKLDDSNEVYKRGKAYQKGKGLEKNINEAGKCFYKVAMLKKVKALYSLACCFQEKGDIEENIFKGKWLYEIALDNGGPINIIFECLENEKEIKKRYAEFQEKYYGLLKAYHDEVNCDVSGEDKAFLELLLIWLE